MSDSVTIEDSKGETFAEVIDIIGVSEVKKAFQQSVKEGSLHKWFKGSKSKDGKPGWVNVVTGGTCASDEPGEGTPKCVSSSKRASMTKAERLSASRRKKKADPGQQEKTGAAKPTYVATDKKKKMNEDVKRDEYGDPIGGPKISKKQKAKNLAKNEPDRDHTTDTAESVDYIDLPLEVEIPNTDATFRLGLMFRESLEINKGMLFIFEEVGKHSFHMRNTRIPLDIAFVKEDGTIESIKELTPYSGLPVYSDGEVLFAIEANRGWFTENNVEVGDEIVLGEAKDKKGKGSGKKDACYHKVKSRYSVWPSAYASGALVKCRKKGAANWGNKSESVEMKNYLDKKAKMLTKKRNAQSDAAKNNPHFDSTQPSPSGRNKYEEVKIDEAKMEKGYISNVSKADVRNQRRFGKKGSATPQGYFGQKPSEKAELAVKRGEEHKARRGVKTKGMKEGFSNWRSEIEEGAAWTKKSGKNPEGGLNEKGRKSYERENPGSDLKAPSKKVGNKRRSSFCARMKGMKKKLTSAKTANDPDSRINKSLRAWNC